MLTVAVVDVGSNAIRLLVTKVSSMGKVLDSRMKRYALRLGTDAFKEGIISRRTSRALEDVFANIASLMEDQGVERYRVVGTSAMREVSNATSIVKRIKRSTGVEIEVISGELESSLSRGALLRAIGGPPRSSIIIDLGGGSLEIQRSFGRAPLSIPFGTVRLLSEAPTLRDQVTPRELEDIREHLRREFRRAIGRRSPARVGIGTGGNLTVLSRHLRAAQGAIPRVDLPRLREFSTTVAGMSLNQRMKTFGLREDRADLAVVATVMIELIVESFQIETLLVPGTGLREELLYRLASDDLEEVLTVSLMVFRPYERSIKELRGRVTIACDLVRALWPLHGRYPPLEKLVLISSLLSNRRGYLVSGLREWLNSIPSAGKLLLEEEQWRVVAGAVGLLKDFDTGKRANWRKLKSDLTGEEEETSLLIAALLDVANAVASCGRRGPARLELSGKRPVLNLSLRDGQVAAVSTRRLGRALGRSICLK